MSADDCLNDNELELFAADEASESQRTHVGQCPDCQSRLRAVRSGLPVTSMTMIQKAAWGDDVAWDRLVNTYGRLVYAQCLNRDLQAADCADVVSEVFTSLYDALRKGNFSKESPGSSFLNFLRRITSLRIIDHWRRESKRPDKAAGGETDWLEKYHIPNDGDVTDEHANSVWDHNSLVKSLLERIFDALADKFAPKTLEVFRLVVLDGLTVKEASEKTGMSETAIRTNISRIRKWILENLPDLPDELAAFTA